MTADPQWGHPVIWQPDNAGVRVSFEVPGEPTPKASVKVRVLHAGKKCPLCKRGFSSQGTTYFPTKTKNATKIVQAFARNAMHGRKPLEGPVVLMIRAYRAIGMKSLSKKKTVLAENGFLVPFVKPDADNYSKLVCDGMSKIVFKDDGQVVDLRVQKFLSSRPRFEIECWPHVPAVTP